MRSTINVPNLNLWPEHHLVVLTSDGKRIQSLRFEFSETMMQSLASISTAIRRWSGNRRTALCCKSGTSGLLALDRHGAFGQLDDEDKRQLVGIYSMDRPIG
jgi:hypothetical protein